MNLWEKAIFFLTIGLTAAVLVRMSANGLVRIYKLFYCYLAVDFLSAVIGLTIPYNTSAYGLFYFRAQTVKIVIACLVVMEIYSVALESTPALARYGRRTVGYILAIAGSVPAIFLFADSSGTGKAYPYLRLYFLFEQTVDATIAMFLILICLFIAWFPVRLRRNVVVYVGGFIVWSLTRSAAIFMANHYPRDARAIGMISAVQMCVTVICLVLWLFWLRREGENRTAVVGHLWNRAEAEKLTEQLEKINNSLEKLRRR